MSICTHIHLNLHVCPCDSCVYIYICVCVCIHVLMRIYKSYMYIMYICIYNMFAYEYTICMSTQGNMMQKSNFAGAVATVPNCNLEYSVERSRRFLHYLWFTGSRNGSERSQTVPNYSPFLKGYSMERSRRFPTIFFNIAWNGRDRFFLLARNSFDIPTKLVEGPTTKRAFALLSLTKTIFRKKYNLPIISEKLQVANVPFTECSCYDICIGVATCYRNCHAFAVESIQYNPQ